MTVSQIKTGAALSYVALALGTAVTFFYTPFMLRKLGQAEYGLYSLANTTIAYLTILDFGFGNAVVRYTAKFRAEHDREREERLHGMFLALYLGIGLVALLLAAAVIANVDRLFSASLLPAERDRARILMWLAAGNLAMSFPFSVFPSIITAHERFVFAKAVHILRLAVNPLVLVAVLLLGHRAVGLLAASTALNVLFNTASLLYCTRRLGVRLRFFGFETALFKQIAGYSFFVFLNLVVDRLYWSTGQFLLGILKGTVAVAVYTVGLQFVTVLFQISGAISGLFLPRVTRISVRETATQENSELFVRVGRLQFILLGLAVSGFVLYGRQFILLWAGPQYGATFAVALIMMIPVTVPLIQNLGISILQANNTHAFRSVAYLAIAVANVAISVPLIRLWGPVGSAAAMALSLVVGQIIIMNIYYGARVRLDVGRFWREIGGLLPAVLAPFALGYLALHGFPADRPAGLAVSMLSYAAVYCLSVYLLGMNRSEKLLITDPLRQAADRIRTALGQRG